MSLSKISFKGKSFLCDCIIMDYCLVSYLSVSLSVYPAVSLCFSCLSYLFALLFDMEFAGFFIVTLFNDAFNLIARNGIKLAGLLLHGKVHIGTFWKYLGSLSVYIISGVSISSNEKYNVTQGCPKHSLVYCWNHFCCFTLIH